MKSHTVASLFLSIASVSNAGLTYNPGNSTFSCTVPNGAFCAGDSMSQDIMISFKDGVATVHDCCADMNDNNALCYQSSTEAGDAACASNGTAYPVSGSKFSIPPAPAGKNNTTPNTPALISTGDDDCECGGPPPKNGTVPPMPAYPSSAAGPVKSSPAPGPSKPTTPVAPVIPPYPTGSGGYKPSSPWSSGGMKSSWSSPTPSPPPVTYAASSTAKAPVYTGAAVAPNVGVEMIAAAGFAVLLL